MDRALFMQALGVEFGSPDLHKVECHRSLNPGLPWPEGGVEIQILDVQGPARLTNIANQQRVCFKQGTDIRDGPWTISPLYACHYTAVHTHPHLDTRGGGREGKRDSKKKKKYSRIYQLRANFHRSGAYMKESGLAKTVSNFSLWSYLVLKPLSVPHNEHIDAAGVVTD